MTEFELDHLLTFEWPAVIRWAKRQGDDWLLGFALSIAGKGKRKSWHPSPKQERIMRQMRRDQLADDRQLLDREAPLEAELIER